MSTNHVCLRLRLEPLSIGHLFVLGDISSPFIEGGPVSIVQLSDAVFICSQHWTKAEKDNRRWWFPWFLKLWARRSRGLDIEAERVKFSAYFAEQTDFPLAKMDRFARREYGSPWWWRLLAIMMSEFNMPEASAMNMNARRAAMLFSAKAELDGKLKLWTNADDSFDAFCREMDARGNIEFPPAGNNENTSSFSL